MKKVLLVVVVAMFVVTFINVTFSFAKESVVIKETGSRGCFIYPWDGGDKEFVMFDSSCSGGGYGGIITSKTKLRSNRKDINMKNLDLLSKKEVIVFAKLRTVGKGEGSKTYCDELYIFIPSK